MLPISLRLWQICHIPYLTKFSIQIIYWRPQFVKLVIIRALRIELFLFLKCRQIWIFSNIFLNSFLHQTSAQHIIPEVTYIRWRGKRMNSTISKKLLVPYTVRLIGLLRFVWLLYKFFSPAGLASIFSVKNVLKKLVGSADFENFSGNFIFSLNLKTIFKDYVLSVYFHLFKNVFLRFPDVLSPL